MTEDPRGPSASWRSGLPLPALSSVDLDDLLHEVLGRVGEVVASRERLRALLDAVVAIGADLDLRSTLERIVRAACRLAGARYGALGVIGSDRMLIEFITEGVTAEPSADAQFPRGAGAHPGSGLRQPVPGREAGRWPVHRRGRAVGDRVVGRRGRGDRERPPVRADPA